ncbi:Uncharacterised protein [uncultured archaeon]|nr:Uncharacterised protein [uncultured archaeon]
MTWKPSPLTKLATLTLMTASLLYACQKTDKQTIVQKERAPIHKEVKDVLPLGSMRLGDLTPAPLLAVSTNPDSAAMASAHWRNQQLSRLISFKIKLKKYAALRDTFDLLYDAPVTGQNSRRMDTVLARLGKMEESNRQAFKAICGVSLELLGAENPYTRKLSDLGLLLDNPYEVSGKSLVKKADRLITELYQLDLQ